MNEMTAQERERVQDIIARRHLQVRYPIVGRRQTDRKPTDFRGNLLRYIGWQFEQEPWRRA